MPQTSPTNRVTTRRASEAARLAAQRPGTASPPTSPSPASSPSQTSSSALTEEHAESSAPKPVKEKRKRSRVTPDQLAALEGIFAVDRSPTATRRKEISEELGMDERQTQVWFQNRRAKAKLLEQGKIMSKGRAVPLASRGSSVSGDWEEGLTQYIHEEEPVKFVRCTELSIGSWTRRASATSPSDLIIYINDTRQRLSFFVNSEHSTCSVKMDIPFSTIKDINLMPALPNAPSIAKVVLLLRQPPAFFMATAVADTSERREWTHCHDWTEGFMATSTLRHTIIGRLEALNEMYSHLNARLPSFPVYDTPPSFQYASPSPSLSPSSNYVTTGPTTSYTQPVEVYGILPSSSPPIGVNSPAYSTTSSMYPYPTSPPTNPSPFFAGSLDAGSGTGFSSYPAQAPTPVSLSTMPFEPVTLPRRTSVADYAYMGHPTYEQSWFQG